MNINLDIDFGDTINAMCGSGREVETTEHFLSLALLSLFSTETRTL